MMAEIIFTLNTSDLWISESFYPTPASKEIPEWYKNMKTSFADNTKSDYQVRESQTIKRCMPVFDAITAGYIIKTHTDIEVIKKENGELEFIWATDNQDSVSFHPGYQLLGYKNQNFSAGVPKFRNPWNIETSKGYSCLFISPTHRPTNGFRILEGIVDTDGYTNAVQFPFIVDEEFSGTIPAGTPMAQVIPFKRENYKMRIGGDKERLKRDKVHRTIIERFLNGYRNFYRVKKDYQ
jgi:hypothetical protein